MSDIDTRLNKARSEVNLAENTLGRAPIPMRSARSG